MLKHVPSEIVTLYIRGSAFFAQKTKELTLKKFNSINGLVSVHFFYIKRPIKVESHMYRVSNFSTPFLK